MVRFQPSAIALHSIGPQGLILWAENFLDACGVEASLHVSRLDLHGDWLIAAIGVALALLSMRLSLPVRAATAVLAVIGVLESLPAAVLLLAAVTPEYASAQVRVGPGAPLCLAGALVALGAALWPERRPAISPSLASGTT